MLDTWLQATCPDCLQVWAHPATLEPIGVRVPNQLQTVLT